MELKLEQLVLLCKQGEERIAFSPKLSFFHGEMSTGKSTIVEMVNFCLGAALVRTPAVTNEVIGVQLMLIAGSTDILIERSVSSGSKVDVTWRSDGESRLTTLPLIAAQEPIVGTDVFNLSDFLLRALGIPLLKVRQRKGDPNSEMHRLGFRDFYKFVYLDQDELDSSLFLLETPIRQEKSKDVLRYVLGLHSEELIALEMRLSDLRQQQREMRDGAKQIDEFLGQYGFNSERQIEDELARLDEAAQEAESVLKTITPTTLPTSSVSEEDGQALSKIVAQLESAQLALLDIEEQIREQEALRAELLSLKFKVARSSLASQVLEGADFQLCPACGSQLAGQVDVNACRLCHSALGHTPQNRQLDVAVVERDLTERVEELERSMKRLQRSRERNQITSASLSQRRGELQLRVDAAKISVESQYMQRIRALESQLGGLKERRRLLTRVKEMPGEIERRLQHADGMSQDILAVERQLAQEQEKFQAGRANIRALEQNFLSILQAVHFPGITEADVVRINSKTWMPYILPDGNEERAWTFFDAGSGGKKVLFKICFALALHLTAAQRNLQLPRLLIIDSTMKNITPDINKDIVEHFYRELYRLLSTELRAWQFILVDQTYFAPNEDLCLDVVHRLMTKSHPQHPPLISYYTGH